MGVGTCDPASRGETWNGLTITGGDFQEVIVDVEFGWDGASIRPDCVGPLNSAHVVNRSGRADSPAPAGSPPTTYYAWFKGKKGTPQSIAMAPGFDQLYNKGQLGSRGFNDSTDFATAYITKTNTPPANW